MNDHDATLADEWPEERHRRWIRRQLRKRRPPADAREAVAYLRVLGAEEEARDRLAGLEAMERVSDDLRNLQDLLGWWLKRGPAYERWIREDGYKYDPDTGHLEKVTGGRGRRPHAVTDAIIQWHERHRDDDEWWSKARKSRCRSHLSGRWPPELLTDGKIHSAINRAEDD